MSAPNPKCLGCRALQAQVVQLQALVADLQAQLAALTAQVAQLHARLNQNSSNSSRPPSSDPPATPKRPAKPAPSGRRPGGQPGHKGTTRFLKPTVSCHDVVSFFPQICAHCQAPLPSDPFSDAPPPRRHQVLDLPPVLLRTAEYQCHARSCSHCHAITFAALPAWVPSGVVGPRLQAVCALLVGRHRMTRRSLQEFLLQAGGEALSLGCLSALEARTAAALAAPYDEARAAIAKAKQVNADETPWRQGALKAWLWTAVTEWIVCFLVSESRSREALQTLVPFDPERTVTCDRYSAYLHLTADQRQVCWAHLLRDFAALAQTSGPERALGAALVLATKELFGVWYRYRAGEIDRRGLQEAMQPVQERVQRLLLEGRASQHWKAGPLGTELLKQWASLWTFVRVEEVEPTNNKAERAVRPGVLWRKISFGNQGEGGRAFVERMLTVVGSLRLQGRGVLDYLEGAIRAWQEQREGPSLMPEATSGCELGSLTACA
jgi:transposase